MPFWYSSLLYIIKYSVVSISTSVPAIVTFPVVGSGSTTGSLEELEVVVLMELDVLELEELEEVVVEELDELELVVVEELEEVVLVELVVLDDSELVVDELEVSELDELNELVVVELVVVVELETGGSGSGSCGFNSSSSFVCIRESPVLSRPSRNISTALSISPSPM